MAIARALLYWICEEDEVRQKERGEGWESLMASIKAFHLIIGTIHFLRYDKLKALWVSQSHRHQKKTPSSEIPRIPFLCIFHCAVWGRCTLNNFSRKVSITPPPVLCNPYQKIQPCFHPKHKQRFSRRNPFKALKGSFGPSVVCLRLQSYELLWRLIVTWQAWTGWDYTSSQECSELKATSWIYMKF